MTTTLGHVLSKKEVAFCFRFPLADSASLGGEPHFDNQLRTGPWK